MRGRDGRQGRQCSQLVAGGSAHGVLAQGIPGCAQRADEEANAQELARRCETLIRLVEKEGEDADAADREERKRSGPPRKAGGSRATDSSGGAGGPGGSAKKRKAGGASSGAPAAKRR